MMESKRIFQAAIVGGSAPEPELKSTAVEVGRIIAKLGGIVICGGLGGIMEGVAQGAKLEQGLTVGILPSYALASRNPFIDIAIPTGLGHARNVLVAASGDIVIALPGSHGTRSEVSIALILAKPVFGVGAWGEIPGVCLVQNPRELEQQLEQFLAGNKTM